MQTSVAPHDAASRAFSPTSSGVRKYAVPSRGADAEGAEFAADEADIGEVDVAGDDVADDVSDKLLADFVGGDSKAEEVVAGGRSQQQTLFAGEHGAVEGCRTFSSAVGWRERPAGERHSTSCVCSVCGLHQLNAFITSLLSEVRGHRRCDLVPAS